jgi:hypothetical protein
MSELASRPGRFTPPPPQKKEPSIPMSQCQLKCFCGYTVTFFDMVNNYRNGRRIICNHLLLHLYSLGSGFVCATNVHEDKWRGVAKKFFRQNDNSATRKWRNHVFRISGDMSSHFLHFPLRALCFSCYNVYQQTTHTLLKSQQCFNIRKLHWGLKHVGIYVC